MRNLIWSIIVTWGVASAHVFGAETVEQVKSQMTSASAQVRATAMEQFARNFDLISQPQQGTEALPIFVSGMSDSDATVREFAATGLLKIASGTMRVLLPANPNLPDLTASPQAQQALLIGISDVDPKVRIASMGAYSLTYKLTPDLEQKIIDEFNAYQPASGQQEFRFALLGSLVNDGTPSLRAVDFLVQKIDDPQFGITALQSLASLKQPPPEVLQKLLNELGQPNISKDRKLALIAAIKAYGPNAQFQLEQILANEKDPEVRNAAAQRPAANVLNPATLPTPAPLPPSETQAPPTSTSPSTTTPSNQVIASTPADNGWEIMVPVVILTSALVGAFILYRVFVVKKS